MTGPGSGRRGGAGRADASSQRLRAWASSGAVALGAAALILPLEVSRAQSNGSYVAAPYYSAPPAYSSPPSYTSAPAYGETATMAGAGRSLSYSDAQALPGGARRSQGRRRRRPPRQASASDPLARKIVAWALRDSGRDAQDYGQDTLDFGPGWPRADRQELVSANNARVAAAESEFEAGWTALTRMNDPRGADAAHFAPAARPRRASPLTQSRAFYWRGRAAEGMGDPVGAQLFYAQAARWPTTFYGQLAAAKTGVTTLSIGRDPEITPVDRAAFEGSDAVRAARLLAGIGARDLFKTFVVALSEALPDAAQEALLVDLARQEGEQALSMKVVRNAARRDLILPERGYPLRTARGAYGGPETAFVLGIVRQESGFDQMAHSGAGAQGMMQLMPATASGLARHAGLGEGDLYDAAYNMTLGSMFLGQLVDTFSGSYVMAAAAYNAGPGRPPAWAQTCGDPRSASTDPINFIECIPFSETRDYVMRVLEATEVYRARLSGGATPNTIVADLRRGGYGYGSYGASGAAGAAR